jgi:hypothetical protein
VGVLECERRYMKPVQMKKGEKIVFVLRLTRKLLKEMKVNPSEIDISQSLFSWHGNIFLLNRRKHVLFVNDLSRLSIILAGVRSSQYKIMNELFLSELKAYLENVGMDQTLINSYIRDGQEMIISKTNNRSVLGTMKEITYYTTETHLEFSNDIERLNWLNKLIYKPIDYERPINVFINSIRKYYR